MPVTDADVKRLYPEPSITDGLQANTTCNINLPVCDFDDPVFLEYSSKNNPGACGFGNITGDVMRQVITCAHVLTGAPCMAVS